MSRVIAALATALASLPAILGIPTLCFALWFAGFGVEALVFALSVFAMTASQIILRLGDQDTRAIQAKLDELIRATKEADNRLIGLERRS